MKSLLFVILILFINSISSFAGDIEDIYFKETPEYKWGQIFIKYKGKEFIVKQYELDWSDLGYFSLQYWSKDRKSEEWPQGLLLVLDKDNKVIREFEGPEYGADFILYDIDDDKHRDLILFWDTGAHSTVVEVWQRNDKDFKKVFEKFNDKNVYFRTTDGVPTLAFKKEYPMNVANHNFPDSDFEFYKWNGKTFTLEK
jgi:hypothetical protein